MTYSFFIQMKVDNYLLFIKTSHAKFGLVFTTILTILTLYYIVFFIKLRLN